MRDDDPGGSHDQSSQDEYVLLRICTWRWRLRLFGGLSVGVFIVEGLSVGMVFIAALGVVGTAELMAHRLARRDMARRQVPDR